MIRLIELMVFQGYMSKVFLIDADWKNKDKNLPDKFVLKVS